MKRIASLLFIVIATLSVKGAIGDWRAYLAYSDITEIVPAGELVYVLSSNDLFSYNTTDESVTEYNKVVNLSDTYITHIAYCKNLKTLVVAYRNSNIDLIDADGNVTNVSDLYRKSTTDDKTINEVQVYGNNAYLSTAFGVVVLNIKKAEISSSYKFNESVRSVAVFNGKIYASTAKRLYMGDTKKNLLDKSQWTTYERSWFKAMIVFDGKLCFFDGQDVYIITNEDCSAFAKINTLPGTSIAVDDNYIIVYNNTNAELFTTITEKKYLTLNGNTSVLAFDKTNKCFWQDMPNGTLSASMEQDGRLIATHTGIRPDSPKYNNYGFMKFCNGQLYTCGAGFMDTNDLNRPGTIQVLKDNLEWQIYEDNIDTITGYKFIDVNALDIDPTNPDRVISSGRTGMYEYLDGKFIKAYSNDNGSLLQTAATVGNNNKNYVIVSGLTFDKKGDLWCFNSIAPSVNLLKLKKDGTWVNMYDEGLMYNSSMSLENVVAFTFDSRGYLWFCNKHYRTPSLYCYIPATDDSEGELYSFKTFTNEDGTTPEITAVKCIAEDKDGNIWIGTNVGPFMLPPSEFFSSKPTFMQIKVPRNDGSGLADYLLNGVSTSAILVDGGNRKWFASEGNGVYLIDSDNITQKEHFLASNSPLLSDNIESLAMNPTTGELFIGTEYGLCSYMTDATSPSEDIDDDKIWAYPNPVVSDYNGLITVVGLTEKAQIKIVNPNGYVVAEGTSNGGTFTWDARDKRGERVASGVYIVMVATADGKKGAACKIAVIK